MDDLMTDDEFYYQEAIRCVNLAKSALEEADSNIELIKDPDLKQKAELYLDMEI